jgi:D-serine deaminase-like pyridoxal phosphate-dependent protein
LTTPLARRTPVAFPLPDGLDTPAVVVDLDVVEANIGAMAAALAARGVRLRPHVKTHKNVELARLQLAAGAVGITVGTLGEAEVMAAAGIGDIFVAYPIWADGPKASRLRNLHESVRLSVGVDSLEAARLLGQAVRGTRRRLAVLVEVDSGERRSGIISAEAAVAVATASREAGLEVRGVFTHGGHAYRSPDAVAEAARDEISSLARAAAALEDAGFEVAERSAGSTPTALLSAADGVTEERPGTYVFGDRQQVGLGSIDPSAVGLVVAATVVSTEVDGQVVIDAGAKALARERSPFLDGIGVVPELDGAVVDRAYDYHGIVPLDGLARPRRGSVVAVVPNHVCPVVNLANELVVVRAGRIVAHWPVDARGRNG